MCGIAGLWHRDGSHIDRARFGRFAQTLRHRGPDGCGLYFDPDESLAMSTHRLGLVGRGPDGDQPLASHEGRWWITYNGEVYNFAELREELRQAGHKFRSETDTEVVLAAFIEWGASCQFRFNGMWAFAICDSASKTLFASRDRFGVKPLYVYSDARTFAFASEVKAFLALPEVDVAFDADFLTRSLETDPYLQARPETLLQHVKRVPAGHSLTLTRESGPKLTRWWRTVEHLRDVPADFESQTDAFRELFDDACRVRLCAEAPIAVSLSGGMDSTSVLATIKTLQEAAVPNATAVIPYTAAFDDPARDERCLAGTLTRHLRLELREARVDSVPSGAALDQMLWHAEDINSVHSGNWAVFEAMQGDGLRVAMTGDGSDELFVAYPWHVRAALEQARRQDRSLTRFREVRAIHRSMLPKGLRPGVLDAVLRSTGSAASRESAIAFPKSPLPPLPFDADLSEPALKPALRRCLYYDFHSGILPWILHLKDACSMAHGIELRSPFMDWRLVCFALSLPASSVLGDGFTKRILRHAMVKRLPEEIRTRPTKVSFVDSDNRLFWRMKSVILETAATDSFLESDLWPADLLRHRIRQAYESGTTGDSVLLWKCAKTARLVHLFKQGRAQFLA